MNIKQTKLTKAEIDILKAYRDGGSHNRSITVFRALIQKGFLGNGIESGRLATVITEKGKNILLAQEINSQEK